MKMKMKMKIKSFIPDGNDTVEETLVYNQGLIVSKINELEHRLEIFVDRINYLHNSCEEHNSRLQELEEEIKRHTTSGSETGKKS